MGKIFQIQRRTIALSLAKQKGAKTARLVVEAGASLRFGSSMAFNLINYFLSAAKESSKESANACQRAFAYARGGYKLLTKCPPYPKPLVAAHDASRVETRQGRASMRASNLAAAFQNFLERKQETL